MAYDASQYVTAATNWANQDWQRGTDAYNWSLDQFNKNAGVSDQIIQAALSSGTVFDDAAKAGVSRYEQMYAPAMQQQLEFARNYASPENLALYRGQAMAGVGQAFDAQAQNAAKSLESYGLDPKSVSSRLDSTIRTQRAATEAAAGTMSDVNAKLVGQQLLGQAINTGQADAGVTNAFGGQATQNRNQAVNTGLATTASGSATMGTPTQWSGLAKEQLAEWPKAQQASYNIENETQRNRLASQKLGQEDSSGIGSLIGQGLGLGAAALMAFSGGVVPRFQDGGPVDPPMGPVTGAIDTGSDSNIVPAGAGDPNIQGQDNVPALVAEGEGVIPQDVMMWRGEQWFQKEIMKARKEMQTQRQQVPQQSTPQAAAQAIQTGPKFVSEGAMT